MKTQIEKKLKKYSAKQLLVKIESSSISELEREVIIEILKSRGQDVSKWEQPVEEDVIQDEVPLRERLVKEIDEFVDSLIADKRTGVYTQVMKALGGKFDSDLDSLLDQATESQMKDALCFRGTKKPEETKTTEKTIKLTRKTTQPKKEATTEQNNSFEVLFTVAKNSKKAPGEELRGLVVKSFVCPRANKEFYKIKTDSGVFMKKAEACKKI